MTTTSELSEMSDLNSAKRYVGSAESFLEEKEHKYVESPFGSRSQSQTYSFFVMEIVVKA